MRLSPAHVREAKEMARALCDVLGDMGIPLDWRDPTSQPPTLQQTQELMAKAMGYASWHELDKVMKAPHEAVYIDGAGGLEAGRRREALVKSMSALMGINYAHGTVLNALTNAGTGMSPRSRRHFAEISTPWGPILESRQLAEGITEVSTGSHGGWLLSDDRQRRMPPHLRLDDAAYEEDGEYNLVVIAFPSEADTLGCSLRNALEHLNVLAADEKARTHSKETTAMLNEAVRAGRSLLDVELTPFQPEPLGDVEQRVVDYLARCVYENRLPIRFPEVSDPDCPDLLRIPSLEEWVSVLSLVPTVNGNWPSRPGPWRRHWFWVTRCEEDRAAMVEYQDRALRTLHDRSDDVVPKVK